MQDVFKHPLLPAAATSADRSPLRRSCSAVTAEEAVAEAPAASSPSRLSKSARLPAVAAAPAMSPLATTYTCVNTILTMLALEPQCRAGLFLPHGQIDIGAGQLQCGQTMLTKSSRLAVLKRKGDFHHKTRYNTVQKVTLQVPLQGVVIFHFRTVL